MTDENIPLYLLVDPSQIAGAAAASGCECAVTRNGEFEPCSKPATTVIACKFDGDVIAAPACTWHANYFGRDCAVPLKTILADVFQAAEK